MNYRDIQIAWACLGDDPRVHPNTPVELFYRYNVEVHGEPDLVSEQELIVSISVRDGRIVLSTMHERNAVAR